MCTARPPDWENALLHVLQIFGLSPECVRTCIVRVLDVENALPHILQTYGLSPE